MAVFDYQAKDRSGREVRGRLQAASEAEAARALREQGLFVLRLRVSGRSGAAAPGAVREGALARAFPRVSLSRRMMFWRQLHTLLRSGVSVSEAFRSIGALNSGHLRRVLLDVAERTARGEPASQALAAYPGTFPPAEVALLRAGEYSGSVEAVAGTIADMNEREIQVRRSFMMELAYPVLVLLALLFIPLLPALVLEGGGAAVAIIRQKYVPPALIIAAAFVALRILLAAVPVAGEAWDLLKLRTPGIGAIVSRLASAKASRLMAAAYRAGLEPSLALELAADSCGNAALGRRLRAAAPEIRAGQDLAGTLARAGALPRRALQMLATGEQTGNVDGMMETVAQYFQDEAHSYLKISAVAAGVLGLLVAAAFVLMKVLGFYSGYGSGLTPD